MLTSNMLIKRKLIFIYLIIDLDNINKWIHKSMI